VAKLDRYHAYGQLWSITAAAITRTPCYYMRAFNFEPFLSHIQRHRITHIQTAPPVLVMLAKRPETKKYDLSSLVNILCGAAPLSKELQNEVSTKFNLKVVQTWGMTEVTCSCLHVPGGMDDRSGSVGQVDPNSTIKLIDESGNEVTKPGQRGEIFVRGPNVRETQKISVLSRAAFTNSFHRSPIWATGEMKAPQRLPSTATAS
jgi:4-coumarate--CoA ligase